MQVLLQNALLNAASDAVSLQQRRNAQGTFAAVITGTATVVLEGRFNDQTPWITLGSRTASGAALVPLLPQVRARVSSGAGTVNFAGLDAL